MTTEIVNPEQWIAVQVTSLHPIRPPMLYVASPVEAQPGNVLATCSECERSMLYRRGDVVDLQLICRHDAPVRQSQDPAAIVAFNLARALRWWAWLSKLEAAVWIMPWYVNVLVHGGSDRRMIELGLRDDVEVVKRSDAVMLCGPYVRCGGGMHLEASTMLEQGRPAFQVHGVGTGEPPLGHPSSTPWRRWHP